MGKKLGCISGLLIAFSFLFRGAAAGIGDSSRTSGNRDGIGLDRYRGKGTADEHATGGRRRRLK